MEFTSRPFALSPNTPILIDTTENLAAPRANDSSLESDTPGLQQSSSHNNDAQEAESSSVSGLPPYSRKSPLQDPFRDGEAPVGCFYTNGLNSATATRFDPVPATTATLLDPLPQEPSANTNPFLGDILLDEDLSPPLPPRPSGLVRGLQIPSRISLITWGFGFPEILAEQGIDKEQWRLFKHELEAFARMRILDYIAIVGFQLVIGHFFGPVPAIVVGWKAQKHKEHENFNFAYRGGTLRMFETRWNNDYFHPLHLHVRIEPPGIGIMDGMDVSSSKLYKYQRKMGTSSPAPGVASEHGDMKEYKYQRKEGRHRMKATRKGRIVILPYRAVDALSLQSCSGSDNGQIRGVTTVTARTSVQDFASLSPTKFDVGRLDAARPTDQSFTSSQQGQSSGEGLYRGSSEGEAGGASFRASAPTTH